MAEATPGCPRERTACDQDAGLRRKSSPPDWLEGIGVLGRPGAGYTADRRAHACGYGSRCRRQADAVSDSPARVTTRTADLTHRAQSPRPLPPRLVKVVVSHGGAAAGARRLLLPDVRRSLPWRRAKAASEST